MLNTILHIDESDKWTLVLSNVKNMITYCKAKQIPFTIEVLANGEAVKQYQNRNLFTTMEPLSLQGVHFVACHNALQSQQVHPNDLFSFITIVPTGIVELSIKQQQGFSYIKL